MEFTKIYLDEYARALSTCGSFPIWVSVPNKFHYDSPSFCLPTAEAVIILHEALDRVSTELEYDAPARGFRSKAQLDYLEERLLHKKYGCSKYQNILKSTEEMIFQIACRHPFTDGNKRTSLLCADLFCSLNDALYLGRDRRYSLYQFIAGPTNALERAKKLELIADWNEGLPSSKLKTFLISQGIQIRKNACEQHIRQYINKFLQETFIRKV